LAVILPVSRYGKVQQGAVASVTAKLPLSGRCPASRSIGCKVVDSASGSFGLRLDLPNPKGGALPEVKRRVAFESGGSPAPG
jgi:hypothetical protein